MKKVLLILSLLLTFLFTGCGSDNNYISTVKSIPISEQVLGCSTTEDLAVKFIEMSLGEKISKSQLNWEIEGKTKNGKMVVAEYKGNKVYFSTVKNGDYIQYSPLTTYLVTSNGKRITLTEIVFNNALKEFSKNF